MTDPTPAAGGLTDALAEVVDEWSRPKSKAEFGGDLVRDFLVPAVERIIAARTEAADRKLARVTAAVDDRIAHQRAVIADMARTLAAVEALADSWRNKASAAILYRHAEHALRAALSSAGTTAVEDQSGMGLDLSRHAASAGTGALDRERAKAWDEGVRYAWDDDAPYDLRHNPYRAAAVSPEGGGDR